MGNGQIFRKDEERKSRKERYEREMSRKEIAKEPKQSGKVNIYAQSKKGKQGERWAVTWGTSC